VQCGPCESSKCTPQLSPSPAPRPRPRPRPPPIPFHPSPANLTIPSGPLQPLILHPRILQHHLCLFIIICKTSSEHSLPDRDLGINLNHLSRRSSHLTSKAILLHPDLHKVGKLALRPPNIPSTYPTASKPSHFDTVSCNPLLLISTCTPASTSRQLSIALAAPLVRASTTLSSTSPLRCLPSSKAGPSIQ